MLINNIGDRIKSLRLKKELTQKELGERLNISEQAISKWERAEALPDMQKIVALSNIFDVSCDKLLKGHNYEELVPESFWEQLVKLNQVEKVRQLIESSRLNDGPIDIFDTKDTYGNYFIHYVLDYGNYKMVKLILSDQVIRLNKKFGEAEYNSGVLSFWTIKKMHNHIFSQSDNIMYKYIDSTKGLLRMSKVLALSIINDDLNMFNEMYNIYMNTSSATNKDNILLSKHIKNAILEHSISTRILKRIGIHKRVYETLKGYKAECTPKRLVDYLTYVVENDGYENHSKLVDLIFSGEHDYTFEKNMNSGYIKKVCELANLDRKIDLSKLLIEKYGVHKE